MVVARNSQNVTHEAIMAKLRSVVFKKVFDSLRYRVSVDTPYSFFKLRGMPREILLAQHRANSLEDAAGIPKAVGAEIDLRTWQKDLILSHDPFLPGVKLEAWLKVYGRSHD